MDSPKYYFFINIYDIFFKTIKDNIFPINWGMEYISNGIKARNNSDRDYGAIIIPWLFLLSIQIFKILKNMEVLSKRGIMDCELVMTLKYSKIMKLVIFASN